MLGMSLHQQADPPCRRPWNGPSRPSLGGRASCGRGRRLCRWTGHRRSVYPAAHPLRSRPQPAGDLQTQTVRSWDPPDRRPIQASRSGSWRSTKCLMTAAKTPVAASTSRDILDLFVRTPLRRWAPCSVSLGANENENNEITVVFEHRPANPSRRAPPGGLPTQSVPSDGFLSPVRAVAPRGACLLGFRPECRNTGPPPQITHQTTSHTVGSAPGVLTSRFCSRCLSSMHFLALQSRS